jgi:hypothetical protein
MCAESLKGPKVQRWRDIWFPDVILNIEESF